jgi:hypothetical protein
MDRRRSRRSRTSSSANSRSLAAARLAIVVVVAAGCSDSGITVLPIPDDLAVMRTIITPDDFMFEAPTCDDAVKNGSESDVDCGGRDCAPCPVGKQCLVDGDCKSALCDPSSMACVSCADTVVDGRETDVDCGGPDCPPCGMGAACMKDRDCASLGCVESVCRYPLDCASIKAADPMAADGTFLIDPDGEGGMGAFMVWCDMSFDGGGWTALPLQFTDVALWSITRSGQSCTSGPTLGRNGSLLSFQNASAADWGYLSMKFVPPIQVRQVWFHDLTHSTATACNNMDLLYTVTPASTNDQTAESWYFAGDDPKVPVGYVFAGGCASPRYMAAGGMPPECQMETTDMTAQITREIFLAPAASRFHMVAVQGCGSSICDANTGQAERFYINHPGQNGLWKDGILVR